MSPQIKVIIPARFASKRFPGKPLVDLKGQSMIERVFRNAAEAFGWDSTYVATDDEKIAQTVSSFGGQSLFTGDCETGSDRVSLALQQFPAKKKPDWIINVQGDSPFLPSWALKELSTYFQNEKCQVATLSYPVSSKKQDKETFQFFYEKKTKLVTSQSGRILFASRSPLPSFDRQNPEEEKVIEIHVGVYAYRPAALDLFQKLPPSPLEKIEQLELLRLLENDQDIYVKSVPLIPENFLSIDTPNDYEKAKRLLELTPDQSRPN